MTLVGNVQYWLKGQRAAPVQKQCKKIRISKIPSKRLFAFVTYKPCIIHEQYQLVEYLILGIFYKLCTGEFGNTPHGRVIAMLGYPGKFHFPRYTF